MKTYTILLLSLIFQNAYACDIAIPEQWGKGSSKNIQGLATSKDKKCNELLVKLLNHKDISTRMWAAENIGKYKTLPKLSIPALINNFSAPHGEEGAAYYIAASKFGKAAESQVIKALKSENPLTRVRACDALMLIKKAKNMSQTHLCKI